MNVCVLVRSRLLLIFVLADVTAVRLAAVTTVQIHNVRNRIAVLPMRSSSFGDNNRRCHS